jgi:hypothetical protein
VQLRRQQPDALEPDVRIRLDGLAFPGCCRFPGPPASKVSAAPYIYTCCLRGTRLSWEGRVKNVGVPLARARPGEPGEPRCDEDRLVHDDKARTNPGASSASDCLALQARPVKGAPSRRVATAMTHAPPLTGPPFRAVSGSYRMRHPYASASGRETDNDADPLHLHTYQGRRTPHASPTHGSRPWTLRARQPRMCPSRCRRARRHYWRSCLLDGFQRPQRVGA